MSIIVFIVRVSIAYYQITSQVKEKDIWGPIFFSLSNKIMITQLHKNGNIFIHRLGDGGVGVVCLVYS